MECREITEERTVGAAVECGLIQSLYLLHSVSFKRQARGVSLGLDSMERFRERDRYFKNEREIERKKDLERKSGSGRESIITTSTYTKVGLFWHYCAIVLNTESSLFICENVLFH